MLLNAAHAKGQLLLKREKLLHKDSGSLTRIGTPSASSVRYAKTTRPFEVSFKEFINEVTKQRMINANLGT